MMATGERRKLVFCSEELGQCFFVCLFVCFLFGLKSLASAAQINTDQSLFGAFSFKYFENMFTCIKSNVTISRSMMGDGSFQKVFQLNLGVKRIILTLSVSVINDNHSNAFCANSKKVKIWISIKDTPQENINCETQRFPVQKLSSSIFPCCPSRPSFPLVTFPLISTT